jgi:cytochrome c
MRSRILISFCVAVWATTAAAQMPIPEAAPPDGAKLFRNQCATCHTLHASEPTRQGPTLDHVYDRKIGSIESYAYTPGYRESDQTWTAENLDKYLINPSAMFPGSTMAYRQANAATRQAIIAYLKDQT